MQRQSHRSSFGHREPVSRVSVLGVAILTLGLWGHVVGAVLSAPAIGAAVGALAGAVLAAAVDHRSALERHYARQPVAPAVIRVRRRDRF
jgi:hypothetical protein